MRPVVVVHGGAGEWRIAKRAEEQATKVLSGAAAEGSAVMKRGAAIDAVIACLATIEDSGRFNAGRGSYPNIEHDIELDAGVMDGATMRAGAVAAVTNVPNPSKLAALVMNRTKNVLMAGWGAERLARAYGLYGKLEVSDERERLFADGVAGYRRKEGWIADLKVRYRSSTLGDTVGAVCLDRDGGLAAGTSTGGIAYKLPGRVGDSPIPGAGFYALAGHGAVSTTGEGEDIMRYCLASRIVLDMSGTPEPFKVLARELEEMSRVFGRGSAGAIALSSAGVPAFYSTTKAIAIGWAGKEGGGLLVRRADLKAANERVLKDVIR